MDIATAAATRYDADRPMASRPPTHLDEQIARAQKMAVERAMIRGEGGPDEMPEMGRELTMIEGALMGLEQRAAELVAHLRPIIRESEVLAEPIARESERSYPPASEVGSQLRSFSERIGALTQLLEVADYRLSL